MKPGFLQHARAERVIALGRVALALFASLAVALDPEMATAKTAKIGLLAGFFAIYAITAAVLAWRFPALAARGRIALHIVDLLLFSAFIEFTHASVSLFFVFFLFSLLSALTRFGVRGMILTAAVAVVTYIVLAITDPQIRSDPAYLIMRTTSLGVATLLLGYLGAYHERIRDELSKLAGWPRVATHEREPLVRETLDLACDLLRTPRAILLWEDEDEPFVYVADRDDRKFSLARERPGLLDEIVVDDAWRGGFLTREDDGTRRSDKARELFGYDDVLSADVGGQSVSGRIFFLGRTDFVFEDVAVAEIIGRLVANRLDQLLVASRVRDAAVSDERLRVARDLHDGILQTLTGAALQLEIAHQLVERDADGARERLRNVQNLVAENQRELRALIDELRPEAAKPRPSLSPRLRELAERFQRQWAIEVTVDADLPVSDVPESFALEIYGVVNEAVANAAKHAGASHIGVALRVRGDDAEITVVDDGRGFPFRGTYSLDQLNAARLGPVTLKERVASLGGELVLHSTPGGTTIEVRI